MSSFVAPRDLDYLVAVAGETAWSTRLAEIHDLAAGGPRAGMAIRQRHAVELTIERLRRPLHRKLTEAERRLAELAGGAVAAVRRSGGRLRRGMERALLQGLGGDATLIPLFHQLRTAALHQERGFEVSFAGWEQDAAYDLLLRRDKAEAEVVCEVVSAEDGRGVHRGAWFRLADRIDPDLQTWLVAHPGRYLLKMTLPQGLRGRLTGESDDVDTLAVLHERIRALLASRTRHDHDEAIVLRLDPLLLAGAQADELGLMPSLRREFGPEAHLAVTKAEGGVFAVAARAGTEDGIAAAIRQRMTEVATERLSGERATILAMFVEDTDRAEWRWLREDPGLEAEARQFLIDKRARPVVAVTVTSRFEMFGFDSEGSPEGEVRFRNPGHPAARMPALAPAVLSST